MIGADKDAYDLQAMNNRTEDGKFHFANFKAAMVARCWVDEDGNKLYANEASELGKLPASLVGLLYDECLVLNGITEAEAEEIAGNLSSQDSEPGTD